jgi:sulfur carrier protein
MQVVINGERQELPAGATVATVVGSISAAPEGRGVAVALKGEVVPRSSWQSTQLSDGDRLEVLVAVQGG